MTHHSTTVFAWLGGQLDNVGDSLLRRGYADALAEVGPLRIWAGGREPGYESGLGLRTRDRPSATYAGWLGSLALAIVRGPVLVALNAGEYELTRKYFAKSLVLLPLLLAARARGGKVIWLGAAVPKRKRGFTWLFRFIARSSDLVRWRDVESGRILFPAPMMPDWAFGLGPGLSDRLAASTTTPAAPALPGSGRTLLTVTLRGDRPAPSSEWLELVRGTATDLGLDLCVVVQVERDSARAEAIATTWDAPLVPWLSDKHIEQEALVREVYARSRIVLSDRLHALIMATTEGAVPLGWSEQAKDKLRRHFEGVGMPWATSTNIKASFASLDEEKLRELEGERERQLGVARSALADLSHSISAVARGESR